MPLIANLSPDTEKILLRPFIPAVVYSHQYLAASPGTTNGRLLFWPPYLQKQLANWISRVPKNTIPLNTEIRS